MNAPPAYIMHFDTIISSVISSILGLVGIAFLVQLVLSGYGYLGAGGNKEALAKAQNSFMHAFLGLILTVAAWTILSLAGNFLGLNFQQFTICINPGCI